MTVLVPIGDFSRMTHLSVKALRFYHDQGLLEPARIDPASGYRFYHPGQVPVAQVIRRFRDLDMPLDQVKAVLQAPDVETRTKEIIAHLSSMETKLAELQMSVASLRALLEGPVVRPEVEFRSIPPTRALAVRGPVTVAEAWAWGTDVFGEIYGRIEQVGLTPAGPGGALFPAGFFELHWSTGVRRAGRPGPGSRSALRSRSPSRSSRTSDARPTVAGYRCSTRGCSRPGRSGPG